MKLIVNVMIQDQALRLCQRVSTGRKVRIQLSNILLDPDLHITPCRHEVFIYKVFDLQSV